MIAEAYEKLRDCAFTSDINVCDEVPSGSGSPGGAKLINPLGGTAHQVDGADRWVGVLTVVGVCLIMVKISEIAII